MRKEYHPICTCTKYFRQFRSQFNLQQVEKNWPKNNTNFQNIKQEVVSTLGQCDKNLRLLRHRVAPPPSRRRRRRELVKRVNKIKIISRQVIDIETMWTSLADERRKRQV